MASRALVKNSSRKIPSSSTPSTAGMFSGSLFGMLDARSIGTPSFGALSTMGASSSSDTAVVRSICGLDQSADIAACFGAGGRSYSIEARSPQELGLPAGLSSMTRVITHSSSASGKTASIIVKVEQTPSGGISGTVYGYVAEKAPSNAPRWAKKVLCLGA